MKTGPLAVQALTHVSGGDGTTLPYNNASNGSFETWLAGTSVAPTGWVAELTPTIARDTGDVGYGSYSCKITAAGAGLEGIYYTLSGLRASQTYSVSWRTKVTAGDTSQVLTTGAGTNLSATESTSTTFETKSGTFIVDASGTAVVLKLTAKADGDVVWFDGVMVNEGSMPYAFSEPPVLTASDKSVTVPTSLTATLGNITATHGDVVIGTVGHGIDFSANSSHAAGMTSQLLDDYEEGTWTPTATPGTGSLTSYTSSGCYTKVGNLVSIHGMITITNLGTAGGGYTIGGYPFTANASYGRKVGIARENTVTGKNGHVFVDEDTISGQLQDYLGASGAAVWVENYSWLFDVSYIVA